MVDGIMKQIIETKEGRRAFPPFPVVLVTMPGKPPNIITAAFLALCLEYRVLNVEALSQDLFNSPADVCCLTGEKVVGKYVATHSMYLW